MTKHRWEHAHDWLDHYFAQKANSLRELIPHDSGIMASGEIMHEVDLLIADAKQIATKLDGDQIQDLYQSEMDSDGFFDVLIKDEYPDGDCPDCGEPIPEFATEGDDCENCEHVFAESRPDDD